MHRNYAAIIVCVFACLKLVYAQTLPDTPNCPPCPCAECSLTCPPKEPENIADGTKAALACDWSCSYSVLHVLEALRLYTTNEDKDGHLFDPPAAAKQALCELLEGNANNEDLYCAAQGLTHVECGSEKVKRCLSGATQPDSQGLSAFLEILATANNNPKPVDQDQEDQLFKHARDAIKKIFSDKEGKQHLAKIQDSFGKKDNNVGLFQLLDALPYNPKDVHTYACDLETLRAAYEMNVERLASLIAAKTSSKK
jgi:hypothetical protein